MKNLIYLFIYLIMSDLALAQGQIRGRVTDAKGAPIIGANVFLKNTFDGTSSDTTGTFQFTTTEVEQDTLVISAIGYYTIQQKIDLKNANTLTFKLKEEATELNTVVITAGSFEASDAKRMTILKPLDIVRTASANGDIFGALQTLPGASRVGEQEGLFVRGGSASESKTIIDGMIVQNPFFSSVPDVAQRGRFSPFLFKGTAFSTGGYSAQYGQALSSVLTLESQDLPEKSNWNFFASLLTWSVARTERWKKTSLAVSGNYTYVGLVFKLVPQNVDWQIVPQGAGGSVILRHQFNEKSMLKFFSNYSNNHLRMNFRGFDLSTNSFDIFNHNLFNTLTYQTAWQKWTLQSGISYSYNRDNIQLSENQILRQDNRWQGRVVLTRDIFKNSTFALGSEVHQYTFKTGFNQFLSAFTELYTALFAETEVYLSRKLAGRIGARAEYSRLLQRWNVAPRLSLAYKTGKFSQVSLASGSFYQNPEARYLYRNQNLNFEKSAHLILNYQWMKDDRTFRVEGYYKDYQSLVRELNQNPFDADPNRLPSGNTDNTGSGYAQGFDVFWRDKKTFKRVDYWISYSYLDTKRLFQNYIERAMPTFASKHNLSVVYKHFINKLNLDLNFTYSYASGRPYYNPNSENFMQDLTPDFHNISLGVNYLRNIGSLQCVFIASVSNLLNTPNVFGYRYSPDGSQRAPVNPPAFRSFFLGVAITL
ncbi:MAG: TonB-dependent receptor [Microscillaceae bacterium]|jgi:hypothetical protein|nr:TonB-dependent receptor [Microscillaceae bacterium]